MQIANLGYFRTALVLEAQVLHAEVRNPFRAKLFVFDKGILVTSVVTKQQLALKYFFPTQNVSVQIVSESRLDLRDLTQTNHGLTITVELMKIADLKKMFEGFRIEYQPIVASPQSPKIATLQRKSKKISRQPGRIILLLKNYKLFRIL